jgi:hypothetical protein
MHRLAGAKMHHGAAASFHTPDIIGGYPPAPRLAVLLVLFAGAEEVIE